MLILFAAVILGGGILVVSYMLPTGEMRENVRRSIAIYEREGVYPQVVEGYKMSQLDNCTDAIMLLTAITEGTGNPVNDAMLNSRMDYSGVDPVVSLIAYSNQSENESGRAPYLRYWHGYVVVLKVLLLFFDVSDLRILNMFLQIGMLMYITFLMGQKGYAKYIPCFGVAILLLNPTAISISFQFSTMYYITLLAIIYFLQKKTVNIFLYFFVIGIITAYFDFLTYPLVGLYFPMIFLLLKEEGNINAIKTFIIGSGMWGIGYLGMWSGKWIMGSILTGINIFESVFCKAGEYSGMTTDSGGITHFEVIMRNCLVIVKWPIVFMAMGIIIMFFIRKKRHICEISVKKVGIYIIIAMIPFVWYLVSGSHSYIHYWYTYRELSITAFALLVGIVKLWENSEHSKSSNDDKIIKI